MLTSAVKDCLRHLLGPACSVASVQLADLEIYCFNFQAQMMPNRRGNLLNKHQHSIFFCVKTNTATRSRYKFHNAALNGVFSNPFIGRINSVPARIWPPASTLTRAFRRRVSEKCVNRKKKKTPSRPLTPERNLNECRRCSVVEAGVEFVSCKCVPAASKITGGALNVLCCSAHSRCLLPAINRPAQSCVYAFGGF